MKIVVDEQVSPSIGAVFIDNPPIDITKFEPLPDGELERLILEGRKSAAELSELIKSQFELGPEANMRLR